MLKQILPLSMAAVVAGMTAAPVSAKPASKYITLASQTSDPSELYLLGQQALGKYEFENAAEIFLKTLSLDPDKRLMHLTLLSIHMTYKTWGIQTMEHQPKKAIAIFREAIQVTTEDAEIFDKLGYSYCHEKVKQYKNCLTAHTAAIEASDHSAVTYFSRGQARLKIPGQRGLAYKDMREAVRIATEAGDKSEAQAYYKAAVYQGMPVQSN